MTQVTNSRRAEWAETALYAFMKRTGQTDPWEALGDLMGDFMHYVAANADEIEGTDSLPMDPHPSVDILQMFFDRGDDYYRQECDLDD